MAGRQIIPELTMLLWMLLGFGFGVSVGVVITEHIYKRRNHE